MDLQAFAQTLPAGLTLEDLRPYAPDALWQNKPDQALMQALAVSGNFDVADYLRRYPDVAADDIDPIRHYVVYGWRENRSFTAGQKTAGKYAGGKYACGMYAAAPSAAGQPATVMRPKVSVLIPVYNNAQYLRECFDSVVNQTLKEIEIIIINDGSTDPKAVQIMEEYAGRDKRIRLINKKNTGYGHSMNVGLDAARGEYIGIVESDDYVDVRMYEELYGQTKEVKCDIIKSALNVFWGQPEKRKIKLIQLYNSKKELLELSDKSNLTKTCYNGYIGIQSAIYKHDFLTINKILFNLTPGAAFQDIGFLVKTTMAATKIYYDNKGYYYLRRDNENSSVKDKKKIFDVCYEYDNLKAYMIERNMISSHFIKLYTKRKYYSYIWNYERLNDENRVIFQNRYVADFAVDKQNNFYNIDLFDRDDINKHCKILGQCAFEKQIEDVDRYKISIIIPVYNANQYLDNTITHILQQSYKNFEVIFVDDGSNDESQKIIDKYLQYDKRLRSIKIEHSNAGKARNIGMREAKGDYLFFHDADDFIVPYHFEKTINALSRTKADICVYRARIFDDNKNEATDMSFPPKWETYKLKTNEAISTSSLTQCIFQLFKTNPWNKVFKRDFVEKYKLYFQEIQNANDLLFVNAALSVAKNIVLLNDELIFYRKNNSKSLTNNKTKACKCVFDALLALKHRLHDENLWDRYKQSYKNYVIEMLVWDLKSMNSASKQIYIQLVKDYYDKFGLSDFYISECNNISSYLSIEKIYCSCN